jgi:hypothetical protein
MKKKHLLPQLYLLLLSNPFLPISFFIILLSYIFLTKYEIKFIRKNKLLQISELKSEVKNFKRNGKDKDTDKYNYDSIFN